MSQIALIKPATLAKEQLPPLCARPAEFNRHIVGRIEVVREFHAPA
ncbi:hypothetical protein ACFWR9_05995 [Streptomyces sp. NPDC058534]